MERIFFILNPHAFFVVFQCLLHFLVCIFELFYMSKASFSGAIGWQCSLFDVAKASSWDEVLEALTSNTPTRTDEVLMIFERPLKE